MTLTLTQTSAPPKEPITLGEAKSHLRVDHSSEDTLITSLIQAARNWCENFTGRQLVEATWTYKLDEFPDRDSTPILIPKSPLIAVDSITYEDTDDATQTWSASDYQVDSDSEPPRVMPGPDKSYPGTKEDRFNAVTITFRAGYSDNNSPSGADNVPQALKNSMLLVIGNMYENRASVVTGTIATSVPMSAEWLAWPYRVLRF